MSPELRTYFAMFPPSTRKRLRELRTAVRSVAPRADESISYGVPTLKLEGRPLVYYAAFKHHTSLYPMTEAIRQKFATELEGYKTSKGTIQFPLDQPLPVPLVKRLIRERLAVWRDDNKARSARKRVTK
jgi:uncharacterized protein YdhG (YjbR/CyaY superfamily)